jgi:arginyl-tRNA synthetase
MSATLSTAAAIHLASAYQVTDVPVTWQPPTDRQFGDTCTTVALRLGKQLGKNPKEIAESLAKALASHPDVAQATVAGPGYVNVTLKPMALLSSLEDTLAAAQPRKINKKDAPVIVEYSQPNIAKPLGIHHIIGTVVGQAISNLYEHAGKNVLRWNYLGDWGTQFGKLAVAYEKWGNGKRPKDCTLDEMLDLYVKFHQEAEAHPELEDEGRAAFRKLEAGDKAMRSFWEEVVAVTKRSLSGIYDRLHVAFDVDYGESFYEDKMQALIEEGKKKGVFQPGEGGSLIATFSEESKLPPYLIVKGDGATLYSTRDLAQMRYRIDTYHPAAIYILTDIAQKLHFEQLVATCGQLQWELPEFENVLFGRMRFSDGKMSTRKGNILKLEHVLDEAVERAAEVIAARGEAIETDDPAALAEMMGTGALVFGILSQNRKMELVFDWDRFLAFDGVSAPYLQYSYARAKSVLRKSGGTDFPAPQSLDELSGHDRTLLATLLEFPQALLEATEERLPHKLAQYLIRLCQEFNGFYGASPILASEGQTQTLRLHLTSVTASILVTGARLLTVTLPERM